MRLADFILTNTEPILADWETFARTVWPAGAGIEPGELRDHAEDILRATAADMKSAQTPAEQTAKSKGGADGDSRAARMKTASGLHGIGRVVSGLDIATVVAEYRALRASVIRLWRDSGPNPDHRDLDDLTRFHEAIDQSISEAVRSYMESVSRARQMFLAILGHDLRNPLNAITLTGQVLADSGQLDRELTGMASQITVTAVAMGALIDDLLDFSGTELAGSLPVEPAPMDLGDLCTQVIRELRAAHPKRTIICNSTGDLTGEWDGARLRQVISNLLANAIVYGAEPKMPIDVRMTGDGEGVTVAIHNHGEPIPREAIPTLFDPFVRGEHASKYPGGKGLGLYITRAVIVSHGGAIDVKSTRETGTTFTVHLPRRQPD